MENFDFIQFQKRRDFSEKVNVSFYFVKQNYKSFLKAIIFIAGPPILITSLLMSSFMKVFLAAGMGAATNPDDIRALFLSTTFWIEMLLMMVFMFVGYVAIISTTNNYIILYREKKTNSIETSEVWAKVRESLGMYFGTMLSMFFLSILVIVLMIIPIAIFSQISTFLSVIAGLAMICLVYYLAIGVSFVFVIRGFENLDLFPALTRSLYLVRGKWWSTFGLVFILSIIIAVVSYVFSIPAAIIQAVSELHTTESDLPGDSGNTTTLVYLLNALAYICQLLLYFLPCLGIAFQYFNLVEMKESKGLMDQIGTLGQPPPPRTDAGNY